MMNEKSFLVQKLQSDYENIIFVKNQLEHDLTMLNEKFKTLEDKNSNLEEGFQDKTETVEKLHEKIASLQQKTEQIPELESKANLLREELNSAKNIALSLHARVTRIKEDLIKSISQDKPKTSKPNGEHKTNINNGSQTIHKIQQDQETGQTILTTESGVP